jgi:hypothetical protein
MKNRITFRIFDNGMHVSGEAQFILNKELHFPLNRLFEMVGFVALGNVYAKVTIFWGGTMEFGRVPAPPQNPFLHAALCLWFYPGPQARRAPRQLFLQHRPGFLIGRIFDGRALPRGESASPLENVLQSKLDLPRWAGFKGIRRLNRSKSS